MSQIRQVMEIAHNYLNSEKSYYLQHVLLKHIPAPEDYLRRKLL